HARSLREPLQRPSPFLLKSPRFRHHESCLCTGYQVATFEDFQRRYAANGDIRVEPNAGPHSNVEVAKRALTELKQGQAKYDLVANNCECFVSL
ncbi:lecithin:retinol acyltransferase, partial [Cupriavidus metallidurans]